MAALVMQVKGFQFQGKIYIALDEGSDNGNRLFILYLIHFFRKLKETPPIIPNSYWTLICFAILSMVKCLI